MLFSQTFFYLLMGVGTALGLPALWLFTRAKWPGLVERGREVAAKRLLANFLIGLPVVIVVLVLAKLMSGVGVQALQGLTLLLLGVGLLWSLAGLAGLATHVGESLWPQHRSGDDAWRATWKGGLVVVGCLLIPFVGWFFLLLMMPVLGAGIQVRSWFNRKPSLSAEHAAAPEPTGVSPPLMAPPALVASPAPPTLPRQA